MIASPTARPRPCDGAHTHEIDARNIEPDDARGFDRPARNERVHLVRHVRRATARAQVRVAPQHDALTRRGYAVLGESLLGQRLEPNLVEPELAERRRVIVAAQRILVLRRDELRDRAHAVALDARRFPPRRGHQAPADHEQPEIHALDVAFDDDLTVAIEFGRDLVGAHHRFTRVESDRHALTLVALARLDGDGQPHGLCRRPGFFSALDGAPFGHRHADEREHLLRELFVLRDRFTDRARAVGLRRPHPAQVRAVAELEQAAVSQAPYGNTARTRRLCNRARARTEPRLLVQLAQRPELARDVQLPAFTRRGDELERELGGALAARLLAILGDEPCLARRVERRRECERHVDLGRHLQLDRELADDVSPEERGRRVTRRTRLHGRHQLRVVTEQSVPRVRERPRRVERNHAFHGGLVRPAVRASEETFGFEFHRHHPTVATPVASRSEA